MATWNLATEAFPILASKNYVNQDAIDYGTFTADEMAAILSRVIDGDPLSYWQGSTADDTVTVTLTFSLMEGSALIARSPDLIVLQNMNWKNFVGQWSADGSTWSTIASLNYASGTADNAETDLLVNPSDIIGAKYIRFSVTKTITAGQKKKIGGIIVCLGTIQLSGGFLDYKVKFRESVRELELGDKTISREYVMRSAASYDFWGAQFDCPVVTKTELDTLRTIKAAGDPFILIPEPGDVKRDAYLCHFDGVWGHAYENPIRSVGYLVPMKVKEVGSH
jgi:hypothetical protein